MTDFYSKTSFVINCDRPTAKLIHHTLKSLQDIFNEVSPPGVGDAYLVEAIVKGEPTPGLDDSLKTRLWVQLIRNRIESTAIDLQQDDPTPVIMDLAPFEFEWELSSSEQDWTEKDGIHLFGDTIGDDIFDVAALILKELGSEEVIMTGIAHTANRPGPGHYNGDSAVISADGWEYLSQPGDRNALVTQVRERVNYWLMTAEGADTGHPQGAIYRTTWDMTEADAIAACRRERRMPIDTATLLRPTTFENLREAIPVIDAEALKEKAAA